VADGDGMHDVQTTGAFDQACQAVTRYLSDTIPLGFWSVTRYDGERQVYLTVQDGDYGIEAGDNLPWTQSLCQYAVSGAAPSVVPDTNLEPVYAAHGRDDVRAFVGIPIWRSDGELFGTLCGGDPEVRPESFTGHAPLLELLSKLLGQVLEADLDRAESRRHIARATALAETDAMTELLNRRGWDRLLAIHDERSRTFGDPGLLIVVDLDGLKAHNDSLGHEAGDVLIRRAADVLRSVLRPDDVVARLGGDEFGVLVALPPDDAQPVVTRMQAAFADAGIAASFGAAEVSPKTGCQAAWQAADEQMYVMKARGRITLVS
jgi:diguanylate cyclase